MSSKKKKNVVSWVQCDKCGVVVSDRDVALHENDCPPGKSRFTCPYVLNNSLYCFPDVVLKNDPILKYIPVEERDGLIYLSMSSLQLCGVPIGDLVVVETVSGHFVRKAWKMHDRALLTAAVYEQDASMTAKDVIKVVKLTEKVQIASEIIVKCADCCRDWERVAVWLQQKNKHRVFCIGNKSVCSFFGKRFQFEIVGVECVETGISSEYFVAMPDTFWRLQDAVETDHRSNFVDEIAGLLDFKSDLEKILKKASEATQQSGTFNTRGVLLHGPSGTGKTTLMKSFAQKYSKTVIHISTITENKDEYLQQCFAKAELGSPSILTFDDIDVFCGKRNQQSVSILSALFEKIHKSKAMILVLATTNKINDVDSSLRRSGRFDKELEIPVPSPKERLEILQSLIKNHEINQQDLETVAFNTHGFVGADLVSLLSKAEDLEGDLGTNLKKCLPLIRPSAMKEIVVQVPDVRWDDIAGQSELKHQLKQAVEWPLKYPESFLRLGVQPPRGVLMYGPPGCSKTMIAKALATESGLNFISVKGPELFNKWVGESEKAVREVFRRARQAAPSIVFFDELDALAGERSSTSGGPQVQERVLAQLLTELDGVEALGHVIVVGATNRPDRIDPALLRPGRLDRVVYVPLPDLNTRCEIFRIRLRKTATDPDVDVNELGKKTEGYSGAEVVAVCNEAALAALEEDINIPTVSRKHFLRALEIVLPRTSRNSLNLCEKYKNS